MIIRCCRSVTADQPGSTNDELFTYDKVGNRTTHTQGSLIANTSTRYYKYVAGSNRLQVIRIGSTGGALESSFGHDAEGRLVTQTGSGAKTLSWDGKGRVSTVNSESYRYDPMDYRIGRSGGSLGNRSYYLEGEHLESEYAGATLQATYFRGSSTDELVAAWLLDSDGKTKAYLFHHDQVNSVSQVTGHNGGTTQAISYSAFGQTHSSSGSSPNRLKYTGREDDGTGVYYYRARYYDPQLGRFISEDPLGFQAGINFYAYVANNPVNANDPSGLRSLTGGETTGILQPVFNNAVAYKNVDVQNGANWNPVAWTALSVLGRPAITLGNTIHISSDYYAADYAAPEVTVVSQGLLVHETTHVWQNQTNGLLWTATGSIASNVTQGTDAYTYGLSPSSPDQAGPPKQFQLYGVEQQASFAEDSFYVSQGYAPRFLSTYNTGDSISGLGSLYSGTLASAGLGPYAASGGFVIYPNKSNTNTMKQVYSK